MYLCDLRRDINALIPEKGWDSNTCEPVTFRTHIHLLFRNIAPPIDDLRPLASIIPYSRHPKPKKGSRGPRAPCRLPLLQLNGERLYLECGVFPPLLFFLFCFLISDLARSDFIATLFGYFGKESAA
jgi:hypothetical protein